MISNKVKETVWTLKETEKLNNTQIARRLGISRTNVIAILKEEKYRNEHLLNAVKEIQQEHNESLLDILRNDDRTSQIMNKILDLFNDAEQLKKEIDRNGLRPLATVLGVVTDKVIKVSELDLRKDSPESFNNVVVVNNADDVAREIREHKEKDNYAPTDIN